MAKSKCRKLAQVLSIIVRVAIVTFFAGRSGQVDGVAGAAALAAMVDATAMFIGDAGVWAIVASRDPGAGVVAIRAFLSAKHPGMEGGVAVTA